MEFKFTYKLFIRGEEWKRSEAVKYGRFARIVKFR